MKMHHAWLAIGLLAFGLAAVPAHAGGLYRLDMTWRDAAPASYPVDLVVNVYKDTDELKGTATAVFDGFSASEIVNDAVVSISDVTVDGADLVVTYVVNGYKSGGDFDANSSFEVLVDGVSSFLEFHTSCSQYIYLEEPYFATPSGVFVVTDGDGICFIEAGGCPPDDKLFRLDGLFEVPLDCALPVDLVFRVYENDDNLKGTATATFDGTTLSNVTGGAVAQILEASLDAGTLLVTVEANGWKGGGEMATSSSFALEIVGCDEFGLWDFHTSCSQPIYKNHPYETTPGGTLTWTDGCGGCLFVPPYGDCPDDDKLYRLDGEFVLPFPCSVPTTFTFNVYKGDTDLKGTATATFDGVSVTNIVCDDVACIIDASLQNGTLVVTWQAHGSKGGGEFEADTSFELLVEGCGTFKSERIHTSCSAPIELGLPRPIDPYGVIVLTNGCGGCLAGNPTGVESSTWGSLKAVFR
jgi:hypothetical protein